MFRTSVGWDLLGLIFNYIARFVYLLTYFNSNTKLRLFNVSSLSVWIYSCNIWFGGFWLDVISLEKLRRAMDQVPLVILTRRQKSQHVAYTL